MDTPLFLLSTTPTFVEGSHVHSWFTGHRQHLLLALWQVIKWKNHENTTLCSRTAMLYIFLPLHCVSRCQRLQETVMLRWPACAFSVFPFIIMRSLPLHWHVVPTQTRPFLKAHQNFKLTRATTKWKHEVKNTTPSAADGQTPALLQHLLRLLLFVQSPPEALLDEFSAPSWLYVGAAWRRSDSSAWSTRRSWRGNDH